MMSETQIQAARRGVWVGADVLGRTPGEPLWPEMHTLEDLGRIRHNVGGYDWSALYQQTPQEREGALIKAHQIRRLRADQVPEIVDECRYWDLAVSERKGADWIVGGRGGYASDGRLIIRHIERVRGPWVDAESDAKRTILRDPASVRQGIEVVGQQGGYYQQMVRDEDLRGRSLERVNPSDIGNKVTRAQVWASRIPDGLVYLVDDGTWDVDEFIAECVAFPSGAHDDQVDAVSGIVQMSGGWSGGLSDVPQDDAGEGMWGFALGQQVGGVSEMAMLPWGALDV
jgi:predicted phage terminase large subunit-like protein